MNRINSHKVSKTEYALKPFLITPEFMAFLNFLDDANKKNTQGFLIAEGENIKRKRTHGSYFEFIHPLLQTLEHRVKLSVLTSTENVHD